MIAEPEEPDQPTIAEAVAMRLWGELPADVPIYLGPPTQPGSAE